MRWCILSTDNRQIELYDIINYTIVRDDSTDPIQYSFDYIGAVIRNVPTLPFVTESHNITITIYNRSQVYEMLESTPLPDVAGS